MRRMEMWPLETMSIAWMRHNGYQASHALSACHYFCFYDFITAHVIVNFRQISGFKRWWNYCSVWKLKVVMFVCATLAHELNGAYTHINALVVLEENDIPKVDIILVAHLKIVTNKRDMTLETFPQHEWYTLSVMMMMMVVAQVREIRFTWLFTLLLSQIDGVFFIIAIWKAIRVFHCAVLVKRKHNVAAGAKFTHN